MLIKVAISPLVEYPKVSIIVPALNEEHYIARCLDSLGKQDYPNFEIIAINDSSTDRTGEIMDQYSKNNRRVVVLHIGPAPDGWVGKELGHAIKGILGLVVIFCYLPMLILFITLN